MGRPLSELALRRDVGTSPGEQLERRLAVMVREGRLRPGRRLPSTRRLASRLGVHRNTVAAANRRLADRGLLVVRHGARSRVPRYGGGPHAGKGVAPGGEVAVPGGTIRDDRPPSVAAASADPATARLMGAELAAALRSGGVAADVRAWPGAAGPPAGAVAVALPGPAAARLAAAGSAPLLVARLDPRRGARRSLRRAPTLAVVALLTGSRVLREAVLADADRLRPGEVTVRPVDPSRAAAARSAAQRADLVIADALAAGALWGSPSSLARPRLVRLRLLSPETPEAVVRRLGGRRGGRRSGSTSSRP